MFDGLYAVVMSGSLIGIFLQVVPIPFLVGLVYAIYRLVKIRKRELSVSWGAEISLPILFTARSLLHKASRPSKSIWRNG